MSFARVYRVGVWFGSDRSALPLPVVLCWVDCGFDFWMLLGLFCFLCVTHTRKTNTMQPASHHCSHTLILTAQPILLLATLCILMPHHNMNTGTPQPASGRKPCSPEVTSLSARWRYILAFPLFTVTNSRCIAQRTKRMMQCGHTVCIPDHCTHTEYPPRIPVMESGFVWFG